MKNKNRKRVIGLLFSAAFILAAVTVGGFAQQPVNKSDRIYVEHFLGYQARELNLSETQRARMTELISRFHENTKSLREQLTSLCEGENAAKSAVEGSFDESAVRAAAQSRGNLRIELEVACSRLNAELVALLTAEQKTQLAELRRECEKHRQQRQARLEQ